MRSWHTGNWASVGSSPSWRGRLTKVALDVINGMGKSSYLVPVQGSSFNQDGLITWNNSGFREDERFQSAYQAATSVCGWDYEIMWRTHTVLWAAQSTVGTPGDILEIGTGRGWMAAAIVKYLPWSRMSKTMWLCDRFAPYAVDPTTGDVRPGARRPHYAESVTQVKAAFESFPRIRFIEGELPQSLTNLREATSYCLVHIDLNAVDPEIACLQEVWQQITPGGLVVLDDYAIRGHDLQYQAMNCLGQQLGFEILSLPTGQGLILR